MKWQASKPKLGDERIVRRFAFLPVYTLDGVRVWLEYYTAHQMYITNRDCSKYWQTTKAKLL